MGMLDDAIREHLELKKRGGAPEEEVRRLEDEAFGPIRRQAPAAAPDEALDDSEAAAEPPDAPAPAARAEDPPPAADDVAARVTHEPVPLPPEPAPAPEPTAGPGPGPGPAPHRDEPDEWLADDELESGPQATREFTAADHKEASGTTPPDYVAPDEEGEDLLEETPEFLQETPEHDRLWFEQRPPRDFDFDE